MTALLVALAGGVGAVVRFVADAAVARRVARSRFAGWGLPLGTVAINVSGSLLLGLLSGFVIAHAGPTSLAAVAGTGFCGGYTTFSTASVEGARLARDGDRRAAVHAGGMLLAGVVAAVVGLWLGSLLA